MVRSIVVIELLNCVQVQVMGSPLASSYSILFGRFANNVQWAALDFIVNAADVFAQNAQADQLHAAQEQHRDQGGGLPEEGLSADQALDDDDRDGDDRRCRRR